MIISMVKSLKQEEMEGTIDLQKINSRRYIMEEKASTLEAKKAKRAAKKEKAENI